MDGKDRFLGNISRRMALKWLRCTCFSNGGRWDFVMHGPNGDNYTNECIFREIEPDARIVIEHLLEPWFELTIAFTLRGDQTHLSWDQKFASAEVAAKFRPLRETANEQNLDRLQLVLEA